MKYRILEEKDSLQITYTYRLSDIFGGFMYLIGLSLGILLLYVDLYGFNIDKLYTFNFWILLLVGGFLTIWFLYMMILGLYNPIKGVLQVNKSDDVIIIRDFLKEDRIPISSIRTMYCEIIESNKPRQKYGMFMIGMQNGNKIECFIIRSSISIDLGRKIDKDIYDTANQIKKTINDFITKDK